MPQTVITRFIRVTQDWIYLCARRYVRQRYRVLNQRKLTKTVCADKLS